MPPSPTCTDYQEWLVTPNITSVNLLFVSGYLANPSSFQGHLLIRFDNSTAEFLNNTTNYGAIIPENENPILYIVKGLFGGYDATYTDQQFYRFNHNYVESDMRDIWQYEFNLSIKERQFLAAHTWELLGQKFTYYFLEIIVLIELDACLNWLWMHLWYQQEHLGQCHYKLFKKHNPT